MAPSTHYDLFFSRFFSRTSVRVLYTVFSAIIILGGSYLAIQYAKGNFRFTRTGYKPSTGLLNANSFPTGAEVFVDGKLVTATDDTLYLEPKAYTVQITKDGFSTWQKQVFIEPQLVAQTNALLFPTAPSLTPLTFNGVQQILPSPDGQKIAYLVASASSQTAKVGVYVLELTNSGPGGLIGMAKSPRLILEGLSIESLTEANFIWSPDSGELLMTTPQNDWLISADRKTQASELIDVGWKKKTLLAEWEQEMILRERQYMSKFPAEVLQIATQSAKNTYLSPDKKRLLYTATAAAVLPPSLIPPVPAANTQPEQRTLEPGKIYVYDREEDRNFLIATSLSSIAPQPSPVPTTLPTGLKRTVIGRPTLTPTPNVEPEKRLRFLDLSDGEFSALSASTSAFQSLQASSSAQTALNFSAFHSSLFINTMQWFPDSRHLLFVRDNRIEVIEYDGTNLTTLYSGPFANTFTYPWPDGSRLIILTAFSPDSPLNLYAIELK